jgi:hypothetical protein
VRRSDESGPGANAAIRAVASCDPQLRRKSRPERQHRQLSANVSQELDFADARSGIGRIAFQKLVLQSSYNRLLDEEWVVRLRL